MGETDTWTLRFPDLANSYPCFYTGLTSWPRTVHLFDDCSRFRVSSRMEGVFVYFTTSCCEPEIF